MLAPFVQRLGQFLGRQAVGVGQTSFITTNRRRKLSGEFLSAMQLGVVEDYELASPVCTYSESIDLMPSQLPRLKKRADREARWIEL